MDPAGAVGLPGRDLDFVDQTGEPQTTHLRGRCRQVIVFEIAEAAHFEKSATQLGPVARLNEVVDT